MGGTTNLGEYQTSLELDAPLEAGSYICLIDIDYPSEMSQDGGEFVFSAYSESKKIKMRHIAQIDKPYLEDILKSCAVERT